MPLMRAKVQVETVNSSRYSDEVTMTAVYTNDKNKEDNTFSEATPNASFKMTISNKALHGKIRPGQKFYVDFTEAPD